MDTFVKLENIAKEIYHMGEVEIRDVERNRFLDTKR